MSELLFEVLTEEIPAWMIEQRLEVIREKLAGLVEDYAGGSGAEIEVDATARRIWFRIEGLPGRQKDREETLKGPPERIAFDESGNPTKALEGFLRKNEIEGDGFERRDGYVWVDKTVEGRTAADFFGSEIPALIEKLRWPKMMSWDGGEWIRPVHSVIALVDGAPIDLEIFGIRSGVTTEPHRTRAAGEIEVASFEDYRRKLREGKVVIRAADRVDELRRGAEQLAAEVGGKPVDDEGIWAQWKYLTEYPGLVRAEFGEEYLELPEEVLVTVMRVHQKQLPVVGEDGSLSSSFLAIIDGDDDPDGFAASGNSFVTNARFADALFFYRNDMRTRMVDRVDDLASLQFQEQLGDYGAKTERMLGIASAIASSAGSQVPAKDLELAVKISKVDLQTEMVRELTELQGVMGGIYSREQGLPQPVWQAVYDHYLPQSAEDSLPRSELGAILSLADRIDTLAGFFLLGLEPTGSRDPFALRRAAQGVVRILFAHDEWEVPVTIPRLVEIGLAAHEGLEPTTAEDPRSRLIEFLGERVRTLLESEYGFAYDEIDATMSVDWASDLPDLIARTRALSRIRNESGFLSILDSAKRIVNITPEGFDADLDRSLLEEEAERRLADLGHEVSSQIRELVESRDYESAFESFAAMAPELESFFNDVLVNVEDERIRTNRIALLRTVGGSVSAIADVTRIVVDRKAIGQA